MPELVKKEQLETEIAARFETLLSGIKISSEVSPREIWRYVGIKKVNGVRKEVIVDIAVYHRGSEDENCVELETNKEIHTDLAKLNFVAWFDEEKDPLIKIYSTRKNHAHEGLLKKYVILDAFLEVENEIVHRIVFAWEDKDKNYHWRYMTDLPAGVADGELAAN